MSLEDYFSGKSADVRTIMTAQLQNQLPGLASWTSTKRITAFCGFFMRDVSTLASMVGYVGAPQGAPGFLVDRLRQPCVVHHPRLASTVVFLHSTGAHL